MKKITPYLITVFIGVIFGLRLFALSHIAIVGDEPDDFNIYKTDATRITNFYDSVRAPDQSRLPMILSIPMMSIFERTDELLLPTKSVLPLRIEFLLFSLVSVYYWYRISQLLFVKRSFSYLFTGLLLLSPYLASFSFFTMTTSDSLFLMFFTMSAFYFYRIATAYDKSRRMPSGILLMLLSGLSIASKLTGLVFLGGFTIAHGILFLRKKKKDVFVAFNRDRLFKVNAGVLLGVIGLNFFDFITPFTKTMLSLFMSVSYSAYLVLEWRAEHQSKTYKAISFWMYWTLIITTCFLVTLSFSPIYFNFDNILGAIGWFTTYSSGRIVEGTHFYDAGLVIMMKFGFVPLALLLVPFSYYIRKGLHRKVSVFMLVSSVLFLIYLLAISLVKHTVTWYGLPIFPLLFLPFVWFLERAWKERSKLVVYLAVGCLLIVSIDNIQRYIRWYPYDHFDGAQNGEQYIRWDRAGFVSFEILQEVYEYLEQRYQPVGVLPIVNNLVPLDSFDNWASSLLNAYAKRSQNQQLVFYAMHNHNTEQWLGIAQVVLTSPVYNPQGDRIMESAKSYRLVKEFRLKGIRGVRVWERIR